MTGRTKITLGLALGLAFGAAGALTGPFEGAETATPPAACEDDGAGELDTGTFSGSRSGVTHPVLWAWKRDLGDGTLEKITVLYKPNDPLDGHLFPGASNPALAMTYDYVGSPVHDDLDDFVQFVEDDYTDNFPTLNVDKDTDFEVYTHTIEAE